MVLLLPEALPRTTAAPSRAPTDRARGLWALHVPADTCYLLFFVLFLRVAVLAAADGISLRLRWAFPWCFATGSPFPCVRGPFVCFLWRSGQTSARREWVTCLQRSISQP